MFFLLCRHTTVDSIFDDFPFFKFSTFRRFLKILQNLSEGHTNIGEHSPKISEDFLRLPKTFKEDPKIIYIDHMATNLSTNMTSVKSSEYLH